MKLVYLSVPMDDMDIDTIIRTREDMLVCIIRWLKEYVKPVDDFVFEQNTYFPERVAARLRTMARADYVIFAKNWETSVYCQIEKLCAEKYTGNILYMHGDKEDVITDGE